MTGMLFWDTVYARKMHQNLKILVLCSTGNFSWSKNSVPKISSPVQPNTSYTPAIRLFQKEFDLTPSRISIIPARAWESAVSSPSGVQEKPRQTHICACAATNLHPVVRFIPAVKMMTVLFSASCFVKMITHRLLHLASWNFVWTNTHLATSKGLLNIKVVYQRSRSRGFLPVSCMHDTAWTRFMKCHLLNGATLLLHTEVIPTNCEQYLALNKSWQSCWLFLWFSW